MSILLTIPYGFLLRRWARHKCDIRDKLRCFTIRNTVCSLSSDRPLVYGNVAALMRFRGYVAEEASEDEALDAFDEVVRQVLPGPFRMSLGRIAFSYKHYIYFGFCRSAGPLIEDFSRNGRA